MEYSRRMREAAGYTRTRLARESGVSRWRLAMLETEGQELNAAEVEAVRRVLRSKLLQLADSVLEFQKGT